MYSNRGQVTFVWFLTSEIIKNKDVILLRVGYGLQKDITIHTNMC